MTQVEPQSQAAADPGGPALEWADDREFSIGPVSYGCRPRFDPFPSSADRFCIRKPREVIERYETLLRRLRPRAIAEVGVYEGGSSAMIAQLADPELLLTVDLEEKPNRALADFAVAQGKDEAIRSHWGVDQSDVERLIRITEQETGGAPLDLVIDDASHLLEPSRRTFEALFPRLRPGGEYVLEDWAWGHALVEVWPNRQPLTVLVAELVIACAHHPEIVAAVEIDRPWAVIRRGDGELDPRSFSLEGALGDRGRALIAGMESGGLVEGSEPRRRPWRRR